MQIKILGPGCARCNQLESLTKEALKGLDLDVNIEKIFSRFYYGTRFHKLTNDEKKALQENFASRNISARSINAALMDFSSLLDLNEKNLINFEKYPLKNSVFFQEL